MFSAITNSPFFIYAKVILLWVIACVIFYAGNQYGKSEGQRIADAATIELAELKTTHAQEMAILQGKSLKLMEKAVAENSAKFRAETKQLKDANAEYQKRIQDLSNANLGAIAIAVDPSRGLWLEVEEGSCSASNTYSAGNTQAGESPYNIGRRGPSKCQLSPASARFLVALTSEADMVAEKLNLCLSEIKTVNVEAAPTK